tara:strand:+ start:7492 stop:7647 length:156 start_codon:yes stop_codon:yes gene_type:complete
VFADMQKFDLKRRKYANGFWGKFDKNHGCLPYLIVVGIIIVAFIFLLIFNK